MTFVACPECDAYVLPALLEGRQILLDPKESRAGRFKIEPLESGGFAAVKRASTGKGYSTHPCVVTKTDAAPRVRAQESPERLEAIARQVREENDIQGPSAREGYGDYRDITGTPCGPNVCIECGSQIIVAFNHTRPDGLWPGMFNATRNPRGPYRLYSKAGLDGVVLAEYVGFDDPLGCYVNHRIECQKARTP